MQKILKIHQFLSGADKLASTWGADIFGLILRCYVGLQFFKSGLVKVQIWEGTLDLFRDEYHVPLLPPELAAVFGTAGELGLPLLLFVGLLSRPAALGLLAVNIMAVVSYPVLFTLPCPAAINDHFYWGALLLVIVFFGPGRITLDQWLAKKWQ